jgi:toxin ParE1/3/4
MAVRSLVWAPKARQDLLRIWGYYSRLASPEIADSLLHEIAERALGLSQRPFLGRPRTELMSGLRSILVHPYAVIYRVTDDAVEIVRVLHERRDLPTELKKDRD